MPATPLLLAEAPWVAEEVELDDLAVPHRDGADREWLAVADGDRTGNAANQRQPDVQPARPAWAATHARRSAILPSRMTNTAAIDMRIASPLSRLTAPVSEPHLVSRPRSFR